MHIVPRFETAGRVIPEFAREGWLSPVEGTRLESEKAGFSEVCKILQIVSKVAPVNDLRAFKRLFGWAGADTTAITPQKESRGALRLFTGADPKIAKLKSSAR
jgi:hypothetical protein